MAAIAAVAIAGIGLSLSVPLLALRMEQAGYSGEANGLGVAVAGLSTLLFAPFVPRLAARFGVQRFMALCLAISILSLFAFAATADRLTLWFPLRGLYSCALTGLFVTSEFAVNALAPAARRGLWVGIYSTALAIGFATGPTVLGLAGDQGLLPFATGAVLFVIAGFPVMAWGAALPTVSGAGRTGTISFIRKTPGLMSAAFVFGAVETGAMGLLPVHALRNGMSSEAGVLLVTAFAAGNVLLQIPLGLIADRVPRRGLLLAVSAIATSGAVSLTFLSSTSVFVPVLMLWSGITSGLYMIGLTELGSRYDGDTLASANAAFVACYACGMVFGPPLIGRAVDALPASGLFLAVAALGATTLLTQLMSRMAKPWSLTSLR